MAPSDTIFQSLQITLRIEIAQRRLQDWINVNTGNKSVLAMSAAGSTGRKTKRSMPGAGVYGLLMEMRQRLKENLERVNVEVSDMTSGPVTDRQTQSLESISRIELLLHHLEERCHTEVFDYSAVGLIAEWLDQELKALSGAGELVQIVSKAIKHVQTTSGQGQSEIWSLFRSAFDVENTIPEDLLQMADTCRDPSKSHIAD